MGVKKVTEEAVRTMSDLRAHGMTNAQVARHMGVDYNTVLRHIGYQAGQVGSCTNYQIPAPSKPYTVVFTAKTIRFDRSGAVVTFNQNDEVSVEVGKDLLVFAKAEYKDFVNDLKLSLEI